MSSRTQRVDYLTLISKIEANGDEATAVARVAEAARDVRAASTALEAHFREHAEEQPTLLLSRLAAGMTELQEARASFDALLTRLASSS
jgi:hypothetical protein